MAAAKNVNAVAGAPECAVCGSRDAVVWKEGNRGQLRADDFRISDAAYGVHPRILTCLGCGLKYTSDPEVRIEDIPTHYTQMVDLEYEKEVSRRLKIFDRILTEIETTHQKHTLLDVGCATGDFLVFARERGWNVTGVELSQWGIARAREKGLSIAPGVEALPEDERFSVITLLDVIEHVIHPRDFLWRLGKRQTSGDLLCLVTPDSGSLVARFLGERWWHIRTAHIFYFNKSTIGRLLGAIGYKVVKIRPYTWYFSLSYLLERIGQVRGLHWIDFATLPLARTRFAKKVTVPLCLWDSMEVYAVKV